MNNQEFFKMLHKAITGSDARRQKAALALRDKSFIRKVDQSYPAALILKVVAAHRTLRDQIAVKDRDEAAFEKWLETQAERADLVNA